METTITPTDDRFSFHRILMVARYYFPTLKWQLVIYLALSVLASAASAGLFHLLPVESIALSLVPVSMLWYLFYLGPAAFGIPNGLELTAILPARNSEKAIFALLYCFVILPVVIFLPSELIMYTSCDVHALMSNLSMPNLSGMAMPDVPDSITWFTIVGYAAAAATCLYIVLTQKRQRILKAIALTILFNFVLGFIMGLTVGLMGFYSGFEAALADQIPDPEIIVETLFLKIAPVVTVMLALVFCYLCAMLVMIWRSFATRQI